MSAGEAGREEGRKGITVWCGREEDIGRKGESGKGVRERESKAMEGRLEGMFPVFISLSLSLFLSHHIFLFFHHR